MFDILQCTIETELACVMLHYCIPTDACRRGNPKNDWTENNTHCLSRSHKISCWHIEKYPPMLVLHVIFPLYLMEAATHCTFLYACTGFAKLYSAGMWDFWKGANPRGFVNECLPGIQWWGPGVNLPDDGEFWLELSCMTAITRTQHLWPK